MLLTLDLGNTTLGVHLWEGTTPVQSFSLPTPEPEAIASVLNGLHTEVPIRHLKGILVSSVVPEADAPLATHLERIWGSRPLFLTHRSPLGFTLDLPHPERVGADLLAGVAGALALTPPPLMVVDSGTATTIMLLDREKRYLGGAILPGLDLSVGALTARTAKIRDVRFAVPQSLIGKDTASSIQAGVYYTHVGGLDWMIRHYRDLLGPDTAVVLTGGAMSVLCRDLRPSQPLFTDPLLVERGLIQVLSPLLEEHP